MTWNELMTRIRLWYPPNPGSESGWLHKMTEELGELAGAYVKEKPKAEEEGEAADLLICLILYCQTREINLLEAAHAKMIVNESRTGRRNRFGIFVKSADLR